MRRGDKVYVLPPRGQTPKKSDEKVWLVRAIERKRDETATARLVSQNDETELLSSSVDDLVVVAEFRDPIYPGLVSTGKVERGDDRPSHVVINAENYHALQLLLFTNRAKVDCIYIDPPYNTGAKDWKYNNDYVEADDHYRHSKWLAFMERRLLLARELLDPENSVLIVTIDEKEVHRLALLLEQVFDGLRLQMVTVVTNQRGVSRGQEFARVEEHALVVFIGAARVAQSADDRLTSEETIAKQRIDIWNRLMRRGTDSLRSDSPKQFYPIFINPENAAIVSVGDPLALGESRHEVSVPPGLVAVWPMRTNGAEGRWTLGAETLRRYATEGMAKVGAYNKTRDSWSISYLISKDIKRIESGEIMVTGRDGNGVLQLELSGEVERKKLPRTVWLRDSHNAGTYGSELLSRFIPGRKFPFPKSLYLVEDMLRVFLADRPQALVLDFFSGSGTTAHAVMRLNRQDGGRRRTISVTNNEVSADEQARLRRSKLRPGDTEWESLGICDYITKPRLAAAVTGVTSEGQPIKGEYKFIDEFPMAEGFAENLEFFTLTYEAPLRVASNRDFARIAPLLWLRAGGRGSRIENIEKGWATAQNYGVLADFDKTEQFLDAVGNESDLQTVFVITDDDWLFESICRGIPEGIEPVRLYEAYLRNFEIEAGRAAR